MDFPVFNLLPRRCMLIRWAGYCRESSTAMIVANMPYAWALVRRTFKLESFFGHSEHDVEGTDIKTTTGMSVSRVHFPTDNRKASTAALPSQNRSQLGSEPEVDKQMTDTWKEQESQYDTDAMALSSNGTSAGVPLSTTTGALDKLYPLDLDDDEIELVERVRHRDSSR